MLGADFHRFRKPLKQKGLPVSCIKFLYEMSQNVAYTGVFSDFRGWRVLCPRIVLCPLRLSVCIVAGGTGFFGPLGGGGWMQVVEIKEHRIILFDGYPVDSGGHNMWWSTKKAPRGPAADSACWRTARAPEGFQVVGAWRQGRAECEADLLALPRSNRDLHAQFPSSKSGGPQDIAWT